MGGTQNRLTWYHIIWPAIADHGGTKNTKKAKAHEIQIHLRPYKERHGLPGQKKPYTLGAYSYTERSFEVQRIQGHVYRI